MLDTISTAGTDIPAPHPAQSSGNRAVRAARDAVDGHNVWDLDPFAIENRRVRDRLEPGDIHELREAIETNGQTVPILVRRDPDDPNRYLLVYGFRRLEAIRSSEKVKTVRAIVANIDDDAATRAQISENMARRDLTYIERALFASELMDKGFGTQAHVAEILTVTRSSVSMALNIVETVGRDLATAIGPAPGVGRPRWEALAEALDKPDVDRGQLTETCARIHRDASTALAKGTPFEKEPSVMAFEEVLRTVSRSTSRPRKPAKPKPRRIRMADGTTATLTWSNKGVTIDIAEGPFAAWVASDAQPIIEELHARWKDRAED